MVEQPISPSKTPSTPLSNLACLRHGVKSVHGDGAAGLVKQCSNGSHPQFPSLIVRYWEHVRGRLAVHLFSEPRDHRNKHYWTTNRNTIRSLQQPLLSTTIDYRHPLPSIHPAFPAFCFCSYWWCHPAKAHIDILSTSKPLDTIITIV